MGFAGDDHAALVRQHGPMYPAFRALPVADLAPGIVLRDYLDRHVLLDEDPLHRIAHPRAGADVDFVGAERDIAWHAIGFRPRIRLRDGGTDRKSTRLNSSH